MKLVICAVIFAFVAVVQATDIDTQGEEQAVPLDYWEKDYDTFYDIYADENNNAENSAENVEKKDEIPNETDNEEKFDALMSDYQFEDNRSNPADKEAVKDNNDVVPLEEPLPDDGFEINADDLVEESSNDNQDTVLKENNEDDDTDMYDEWWGDVIDDEVAPLPVPEEKEEPLDEVLESKNEDPALQELEDLIAEYDDVGSDNDKKSNEDQFEDEDSEVNKESLEKVPEERNVENPVKEPVIEDKLESEDSSSDVISGLDDLGSIENNKNSQIDDDFDAEVKIEELPETINEDSIVETEVKEEVLDSEDDLSQRLHELEQLMEQFDDLGSDEVKKSDEDPFKDFDAEVQKTSLKEVAADDLVETPVGEDKNANFSDNKNNNEDQINDTNNQVENYDSDTPEKVLDDLDDDLAKLFEALDKLNDDSNDSDLGEKDAYADVVDKLDDGESYILSLRDDYDKVYDSNLEELVDEINEKLSADDEDHKDDNAAEQEDIKQAETKETLIDKEKITNSIKNDDVFDSIDYSSELGKLLAYDDNDIDEKIDELVSRILRPYGEDGLIDDQMPVNEDAEVFSETKVSSNNEEKLAPSSNLDEEKTTVSVDDSTTLQPEPTETNEKQATIMVDDLNSSEYDYLMEQFAIAHSEDLDVKSDSFDETVDPIHISLSIDEPTIITSPDHPQVYPLNTTVDWIIDGPGTGIEMNLTHCQINGVNEDYLLVIPGGRNANRTDGIVFSFRLNSVRRYRFLNVNRMFVRFHTNDGFPFFNGFSMSAKLIWPLPQVEEEELPEPEQVLQPPRETLVLSLGGLSLNEFDAIRTDFKELIADMAQQYILDNNIDQGLNTTREVTQIIRTAVCNVRWPDHETCLEVTFGVPLHYEEADKELRLNAEDLGDMWRTYIVKEEFAARLDKMGIREYAIPDDRSVLIVWLVIAAGVIISMAMLGFALWRFSCFEDYTRMKAFSDSDSIQNEKRNLDLYPTPHQTLPPLYSDNDYKWADEKYDDSTRVDLGGFANRSYIRDDVFDLDSDEDIIISPHDRQGVITPRDVYNA